MKECTFKPQISQFPNSSVIQPVVSSRDILFSNRRRSNSMADLLVQRDIINLEFKQGQGDDAYLKKLGQLYGEKKVRASEILPALGSHNDSRFDALARPKNMTPI